jgi:chaperonin cofactor prefoldin
MERDKKEEVIKTHLEQRIDALEEQVKLVNKQVYELNSKLTQYRKALIDMFPGQIVA